MIANALKRPADADLVTVCIVPFGRWEGHPMGSQDYGPEEGAVMVQYFKGTYAANGKPMPIDYGHDSLYKGDAPAAGWIWDLFVGEEPDENGRKIPGVYGLVEWTAKASEGIKAKEYSGALSPVIEDNAVDPVTGATIPVSIYNAALTIMPFMLDKMPQATANGYGVLTNGKIHAFIKQNGGPMDPQKVIDDVIAAMPMLPAGATIEDAISLLKKISELMALAPGAPPAGQPIEPALPEMMAAMKTLTANGKIAADLADLLKCKPDELLANTAALKNKAESVKPDELQMLRDEVAAMKAEELIKTNARKIKPEDREFWTGKAKANHADTAAILDKLPNILPDDPPSPVRKENKATDEEIARIRKVCGTEKYHKEDK